MRSRWACTVCWTQGGGISPGECPTCGAPDAWYERVTTDDRPLREYFKEMVARMTHGKERHMEPGIDVEMLDGMTEHDCFFVSSMRGDLMRWLREQGQPTEGVQVLAVAPMMSTGDAPEYGVVLWRGAAGTVHVWTAWQYRDPWDAAKALKVLTARAETYERYARWSRAFVAMALQEQAFAILDRAPDVPPDPGDELPDS